MDNTRNAWKEHLVMVGESEFHSAHRIALEEIAPNGKFTQKEWNEVNTQAILMAVATMIAENDAAHQ